MEKGEWIWFHSIVVQISRLTENKEKGKMTGVYLTFIHERFSKVASIVTKGGLGGLSPFSPSSPLARPRVRNALLS